MSRRKAKRSKARSVEKSFDWEKNINYAAWGMIGLLCVIYIFRTNDIIHYLGGDDAYYILLAKAIVAGEGYRDSFMAGQPADVHFPPMFPLFLAVVVAIFGANSLLMKLVVSLSAASSLALSFLLARRRNFAWPVVAAIWLGLCYRFFSYTDLLLSEALFMALTLGGLLAFDKWLTDSEIKSAVIALVCCWMAELVRTAGITIPAAVAVTLFLKKGPSRKAALQALAAFVILMVPLVAWSARNRIASGISSSYLSQFLAVDPYDPTKGLLTPLGLLKRFVDGVKYYFVNIAGVLSPKLDDVEPNFINVMSVCVFWAFVIVGFVRKVIKDIGITEIFAAAFIGMVTIWPFLSYRFLLPVYPLLFMYAVHGSHYLTEVLSGKNNKLKYSLVAVFSVFYISVVIINSGEMMKYQKSVHIINYRKIRIAPGMYAYSSYNDFDQLLRAALWLAGNGQKDSVIMTRKESLVALAGAKPVIGIPIPPPDDPWAWVKKHQVRYLLIDQITQDGRRFMQVLTKGQEEIPGVKVLYNSDKTYIIEIDPELLKK